MSEYQTFFHEITGQEPYAWQHALGEDRVCRDRMIRIPTGFGKTAGIVLSWLFHRVVRRDDAWPRRLVIALPMRVLVEQTEAAIQKWIQGHRVGLHVLMGGVKAERWVLDLESPAVLVGTQDMILSRALNRGYGSSRGTWPMEHGLLHQDALWALDEVQLMDVGLATSAQLAAFRDDDVARGRARLRPVFAWWSSATLQPRWLHTVDHPPVSEPPLTIPADRRKGGLFEVRKTLDRAAEIEDAAAIASLVRDRHAAGTLTLVIVNRVATAIDVYDALVDAFSEGKGKSRKRLTDAPALELVHGRFRGLERAEWSRRFLYRNAPLPEAGRIIVATQVVEAGVDISARLLVTQLAPWPSLVQRFGRAARYQGESGRVVVVGTCPTEDKSSAPYAARDLVAADEAIARLRVREADASPRSLEAFEDELTRTDPDLLARLYPYEPLHVLRRRDLDDLFDTSADLCGADLDVSRFIRSGDERDALVFWRQFEKAPSVVLDAAPRREELCPVPIGDLRAWKREAYVLDYLEGEWTVRPVRRIVPGTVVLLHAEDGGYTVERGWGPGKSVTPVSLGVDGHGDALASASASEEAEDLSCAPWKTIATHGREAAEQARALCDALGIADSMARIVVLAARWHDVGKAHDVFQRAILDGPRRETKLGARRDLAKAPPGAWKHPPYPDRPGFRHELASTLALFELLRRANPQHPALLGDHRDLFEAVGQTADLPASTEAHPLADEIASLTAEEFDLLAWLVCTHHGKVRCVWTSTPHDQEKKHGGIHGVCDGDRLPSFSLVDRHGRSTDVPPLELSLAAASMGVNPRYGASWIDRVAGLVARFGPFTLTFLEAVLRVADWRASMLTTEDPLS